MQSNLYIFSTGELKRKDNTLCFETEQGKKHVPVENVRDIYVFGEVRINKRLLEFLSQKEILLHYFNYHDYYMGTFYPREHYNSGYMTLKQVEAYIDSKKRVKIAKSFVNGAYKNIVGVLKYYSSRGIEGLKENIETIEGLAKEIENCSKTSELMAIEGNIRENYYRCFDLIIGDCNFVFEGRSKRPPKNELNSLISYGNSILYTLALSEIYKTHLDPRIGYLHTTNFRRFTLNLDIAEIFKPVLVDRTIFSVIKKKMIRKKDFKSEMGGIIISDKGKKTFISEMDKRLNTTIKHRSIGKKVSYQRLIRIELYKLEKHLLGEKDYEPFVSQW